MKKPLDDRGIWAVSLTPKSGSAKAAALLALLLVLGFVPSRLCACPILLGGPKGRCVAHGWHNHGPPCLEECSSLESPEQSKWMPPADDDPITPMLLKTELSSDDQSLAFPAFGWIRPTGFLPSFLTPVRGEVSGIVPGLLGFPGGGGSGLGGEFGAVHASGMGVGGLGRDFGTGMNEGVGDGRGPGGGSAEPGTNGSGSGSYGPHSDPGPASDVAPEPSTLLLSGIGIAGSLTFCWWRRRRGW
jgi:hypothetical protein